MASVSSERTARQRWVQRRIQERVLAPAGALSLATSPLSLRYRASVPLRNRQYRVRERARRMLNVTVAVVGITLTAPLMIILAALVRLTSPGPIIFKQQRVGIDRRRDAVSGTGRQRRGTDRGGRIFTMYKFRTMRVQNGPAKEVWASRNDPRITPIGGFLRATRLDELPQLFNVLKGDMNIVGPRPEQPAIFESLSEEVGNYRTRQRVLPGITGLAQVTLGYDSDVQGVRKKVDLDIQYIRKRSAAKDLLIMARTLPVMVCRKVWM